MSVRVPDEGGKEGKGSAPTPTDPPPQSSHEVISIYFYAYMPGLFPLSSRLLAFVFLTARQLTLSSFVGVLDLLAFWFCRAPTGLTTIRWCQR